MNDLDNFKSMRKIDASDMTALISNFPEQCREGVKLGEAFKVSAGLKNFMPSRVLFLGLGGSAITGDLIADLVREDAKFPILVNRDYTVPGFVDKKTLVFCISYSGNTEETINSYRQSIKKGARIIVISSGGELTKLAQRDRVSNISLPQGFPPRTALGFLFFSTLTIFQRLGLIASKREEIKESLSLLAKLKKELSPDISLKGNQAKKIARELKGKMPIVYASNRLAAVALRFQTQLAENSKQFSARKLFPEMNHNEIMAWNNPGEILKKFFVIFLKDKGDHPRVRARMKITKELISPYPDGILEINTRGKSILTRNLSLLYLGDWVSFYLSILNKVDPTPVERITLLKKKLSKM